MGHEKTAAQHIDEYAKNRHVYESFAVKIERLIRDVLEEHGVKIHIVESRAKTVDSFREKINRANKNYLNPISDIKDLCGCRIITYYADEVVRVAEILKSEFEIIEEELTHQPTQLDADRFGYLSAHYIIKLNKDRTGLLEWRSYAQICAEIQIRTVIQHAWSAVSHALQYKQESAVPSALQRRLHRIAGLFELADEEFIGIREQRIALRKSAAEALANGDADLTLSAASIEQALAGWDHMSDLVSAASAAGFTVEGDPGYEVGDDDDEGAIPEIYKLAVLNGISNINQLLEAVTPPDYGVIEKVFKSDRNGGVWHVSNEFLFYLLMLAKFADSVTTEYLVKSGWTRGIAEKVTKALKS